MRRCVAGVALLLISLPLAAGEKQPEAPASRKAAAQVKPDDLEDFVLKTEPMTFNNFTLTEAGGGFNEPLAEVKLRGSYRNRTADLLAYSLAVAGLDADGEVLWAWTVAGNVQENEVGCLPVTGLLVPPGALKQTASVKLRAEVLPRPSGVGASPGTSVPAPK